MLIELDRSWRIPTPVQFPLVELNTNLGSSQNGGIPKPASMETMHVIGRGSTEYEGISYTPLDTTVEYRSNSFCNSLFFYDIIRDSMLCAFSPWNSNVEHDACSGDSGGPLVLKGGGSARNGSVDLLVGIVSWGFDCGQPGYPGVYARVSDQSAWIQKKTCKLSNAVSCVNRQLPWSATASPTSVPTVSPSDHPSVSPTGFPSVFPSIVPSVSPTLFPSGKPSRHPSELPSGNPTSIPSQQPTILPTTPPSTLPSNVPSGIPTLLPSRNPTKSPSTNPTLVPSRLPSLVPTESPSLDPTVVPSQSTAVPSIGPSPGLAAIPRSSNSTIPSDSRTQTSRHSKAPDSSSASSCSALFVIAVGSVLFIVSVLL
mmetsp:Transcript_52980/g.61898  ORF Transcript_52980/g.61898 Transcript_52980/m.61898 type:complete len:370 (-) Transcript_52980:57-1166(-)